MRTIPIALLAHYESGGTTLAWGIKITRADGEVFGWTSHDEDAPIDGVTYRCDPGLSVGALSSTAGFSVDNTEITIIADDVVITRNEIHAGVWDGAEFELFRYNWASLSDGRDIRKVGNFGNVQPRRGAHVAELRGLRQRLQQQIGNMTQPTCRNRLGDAKCGVGLSGGTSDGDFMVTSTLTDVTSRQVLHDDTRTEPDDWFTAGEIRFFDGDNAGLSFKVKSYAADGTITLSLPLVFEQLPGDAYEMIAGCTKRRDEDCKLKFDNVLNFNGEPDLPGVDAITKPPDYADS